MMKSRLFSLIILLSIITVFTGCTAKKEQGITMSVSILPQKQWLDILTGKQVHVNCLLPPGSNPATYSPTPKQMKEMNQSVYYFYIDQLGFENVWLPKFKDLNETTMFINTTAGIVRLEGHHHEGSVAEHEESDPHLWVSPKEAKKMVEIMYAMLGYSKLFNQSTLDSNYVILQNDLNKLDSLFKDAALNAQQKTFVIYHPALAYIAHDYGFEQISIEKEGKEPTAAYIKQLIDEVKSKKIKYIFIQKQFDKSNAQVIAEESGAELIEIDPLGYDYMAESEKLANYLKNL
ncbi:metal ABC transporter solute-binding protein, Zn/Mn family [Saccharicrinis sp. FJH2]|uniref:metal ABC transporter solute-binding protein, Zn/Mn family n=1 Tax=Saccharicrinis sp. FJH65 TaxID=3344659 RepID=UPI0035F2EDEB